MTTVKEIQTAIEALPQKEDKHLMKWIRERDWERWDEKIARDAETGTSDFLVEETRSDYLFNLEKYESMLAQGEIKW